MKICILGAGAMGALVGSHLKKGGAAVYFLDPYEAHMKETDEKGLHMDLEGRGEEHVYLDKATTNPDEIGECDLVIILVKCMNTRKMIIESKALFGDNTCVMSLQNGLGNIEILQEFFPDQRVGYGVLKASATLTAPGRIKGRVKFPYSSKGLYFSPLESDTKYKGVFRELETVFESGGFPAELTEKTKKILWDKIFINVMYNAPCALVQLAGESFMRHPDGNHLLYELAREVCSVANACGVDMDIEEYWKKECKNIGQIPEGEYHFTSTVKDVYHQRKTEVEFLNGAICKAGKEHNIPTPFNETIYCLMRVKEDSYSLSYQGE